MLNCQLIISSTLIWVIFIFPALAAATKYIVGEEAGWALDVDFKAWAKDKKFFVGDTLEFKYRKGDHDVMSVSEAEYESCTAAVGAVALTSGEDSITLTEPGDKWYICSVPGHCDAGQKLAIGVLPNTPSAIDSAQPPPNSSSRASAPLPHQLLFFSPLLLLFVSVVGVVV